MFPVIATLFVITTSYTTNSSNPASNLFPHYQFDCDPSRTDVYETEFIFLQGLGHGFVHAESNRVFFEYYFPVEHWVAFATADQIIVGEQDHCSKCYFEKYYPSSPTNKNHSNLYPKCIEECLDDTIFVGTVNSDEDNTNNWNIIEFQIAAQHSKKLPKKMYRIPRSSEILEVWGNVNYPYRMNAHFETDMTRINIGQESKQFVHAKFWRDYDYQSDQNAWKPFVNGPYQNSNTSNSDSFCFISIGSFIGGAYPYDDDALNGRLPGFYIDTEHFANIHCYKTNDIKVDCGQKTFADSGSWTEAEIESIEELESYEDSDTTGVTDVNSYDTDSKNNNSKYTNLKLKTDLNENQKSIPLFESKVSIDNVGDIFYRYTEPHTRGAHQQADLLLLHDGEQYGSATWKGLGTLQIFAYWGYKTVAIDLPGYKLSKKATPPKTQDEYIEFIRNIIHKLGLSNVVLIVPSMSGIYGLPVLFADDIDLIGFIAIAPFHTNRYTRSQYESVNIPVMMMYGENDDTFYKSEMLYWMKNIPVNREVMIKNGQHAPFVGNPHDFHKEILRFVSTECSIGEDTDSDAYDTNYYEDLDTDMNTLQYEQNEDTDDTDIDTDINWVLDDNFMQDNDATVINFYTPWCIHCRRFREEWNDLELKGNAMRFIDRNGNEIVTKFQLVDCVSNENICNNFGIRAYPTIRIYNNKVNEYVDYKGERKSNALLEFVKKFIGAVDPLFTTTDAYNIPYADTFVTVKIVAVGIIVIFCVCFCCMRKRRQRSMNILERVESDEFNEGLVDDDVSTLVVIGQQT